MVKTWQEIIARAAGDRDSGSWSIARRAAAGLAGAAAEGESALRAAIRQLIEGQPGMAAIRNLASAAAWAWTGGGDRTGADDASGAAVHAIQVQVSGGAAACAGAASGSEATVQAIWAFVSNGDAAGRAVTVSASSTVEAALAEWRGAALVLESRPRCEGRALASRLARAGIDVTLAVDAAARSLLATGDTILLGADSVTPEGITNKIGSWALAAAARECRLPVYALAGPEKWWPTLLPDQEDNGGRDPREVLPDPIPGVQVRNPYFEPIPFTLITAIVTPSGPRSPRHVRAALAKWRVHPWLA